MEYIKISVKNKIATAPQDALIVCGNSDYFVEFEFDDEWAESNIKTARFYYNFCHQDIVFEGNTCQVPVLAETQLLKVGVFTDNVRTTTDAEIKCQYSIKKYGGNVVEPSEDVYAQIMELLNKYIQGGGSSETPTIDKAKVIEIIEEYLLQHPVKDGFSPIVNVETIENGYLITITDINGEKSFTLLNGKDGENGLTPYIGNNGNWFIGDFDTGVSAKNIQVVDDTSTSITLTPQANHEYYYGVLESLSLSFDKANLGDLFYVTFNSGEMATNLSVDSENAVFSDFVPETNAVVEICGKWNGTNWVLIFGQIGI